MIYTVLDNIMIIMLTGISMFTSKTPGLFIIAAGLLMDSQLMDRLMKIRAGFSLLWNVS